MKFVKLAIATTALFGFASAAQAQDSGFYGAVGVDAVEFDAYTLAAKVGYNINEYFGVEAQGSFGIIDDEDDATGIDTGIDSSFGGFGVVRYPVTENVDIFGRAGYHFTQIGFDADTGVDISTDTDGFALGAGGTYWLNEKSGIRLEYTYLDVNFDNDFSDDDTSADVFTVSYAHKF